MKWSESSGDVDLSLRRNAVVLSLEANKALLPVSLCLGRYVDWEVEVVDDLAVD